MVCAFAFYNNSKERVSLLLKGLMEVKVMVRWLKTCFEDERKGMGVCPRFGVAQRTSTTNVLQISVLFFSSTHEKRQRLNPITGGIFRGCTLSILKNWEVI